MNIIKMPSTIDDSNRVLTVLVADDDQEIVAYLKMRCERLGFTVIAVEDALTALCCADLSSPNAVILDVEMPMGNGLAVCEMLATDERFKHIPAIIYTGRTDEETIRRCELLGAHYVAKLPNSWLQLEQLLCEFRSNPSQPAIPETRLLTNR